MLVHYCFLLSFSDWSKYPTYYFSVGTKTRDICEGVPIVYTNEKRRGCSPWWVALIYRDYL